MTLDGEWDLSRKAELHALLLRAYDHDNVVVDLTGVAYMDSTALSQFAIMRKSRGGAGYEPARFVVPSEHLRKLFAIVGFDKVFPIFSTLEEAIADSGLS